MTLTFTLHFPYLCVRFTYVCVSKYVVVLSILACHENFSHLIILKKYIHMHWATIAVLKRLTL